MAPVRTTNQDLFNTTLIYDSEENYVHWGRFAPNDRKTAHQLMFEALNNPPGVIIRNVGALVGGSIKADGTIEMNSTTLNGIMFVENRSQTEFYDTKVATALTSDRFAEVKQ